MIIVTIPDGRLGADPKVNETQSGSRVAKLRVAAGYRVKDDGGDWTSETLWFDVDCWRSVDALEEYFAKGSPIVVWGELQESTWTDRDGNARTSLVIRNASWTFPPKDSGSGEEQARQKAPARQHAPKAAKKRRDAGEDDDIPW